MQILCREGGMQADLGSPCHFGPSMEHRSRSMIVSEVTKHTTSLYVWNSVTCHFGRRQTTRPFSVISPRSLLCETIASYSAVASFIVPSACSRQPVLRGILLDLAGLSSCRPMLPSLQTFQPIQINNPTRSYAQIATATNQPQSEISSMRG